jgi:hypothetical protein
MKSQLRQYFMSDRVLDAWESVRERERKAGQSEPKKDGLWSIFQAKSGTRSGELPGNPYQNDVQKQMAWLEEETKNLNTYSLKPKQEGTGPKVHTISDNMSIRQGLDSQESHYGGINYLKALEADDSIITALPAFPLPPVSKLKYNSFSVSPNNSHRSVIFQQPAKVLAEEHTCQYMNYKSGLTELI